MNALEVNDFSAWYHPDTVIVQGSNLTIPSGEVVGLLGGNGAGKTTLLRGLCGILPGWKHASFQAQEAAADPGSVEFKKQRYVVFADESSFPLWTFEDLLAYVSRVYRVEVEQAEVKALVEGFNFGRYLNTPLCDLSSGNNKKARLICAFVVRRPLLILDEPVDFLDFLGTEYLYQRIKAYAESGRCVLMSSHIAESFTRCCTSMYVLEHGELSARHNVPTTSAEIMAMLQEGPTNAG